MEKLGQMAMGRGRGCALLELFRNVNEGEDGPN